MDVAPLDRRLGSAIQRTLAYVDLFDFPLTAVEIQRYLVGCSATPSEVQAALDIGSVADGTIAHHDGYYMLPGRQDIVETRRRRQAIAEQVWPLARMYGQIIARLPLVKMVAITGSLAANNTEADADIDFLIVTANDRLWLARAEVILIVRWAHRRHGIELCPNYFLANRALRLSERSLYAAWEVAQMLPLSGMDVYRRLRRQNSWIAEYLPGASGPPPNLQPTVSGASLISELSEPLLRTRLGGHLEQWEMKRKVRRLTLQSTEAEALFGPDWCKGHIHGHGRRVMGAFRDRLSQLPHPPTIE